jgi:hypothetical protein
VVYRLRRVALGPSQSASPPFPRALAPVDFDSNLDALQRARPVPIAELHPDLGPECTELADALLERDPGERPLVDDVADHCEEWSRKLSGRA